ncbi:Uma2 family endonuclease [Allorhizocola rhizosphaerae]|uniref:Uma2 family endonuclease n=1 Tax=Allorhizocola rhizosphaerae TaxID=1872709 RepID=UPI000E3B9A74|nr:Uma2 family endonuclease [Allorhizocola rhizosphaerae]
MTITIHQPLGSRDWRPEDIEAPEPVDYEIVDGNLVLMALPQKSLWHQTLMHELTQALKQAAPSGYRATHELTVGYFRPGAAKETLREPDVLVLRPGAKARPGNVFDPRDVVLAVEVESPSTRAVDRKDKVDEYARAGIPCYWRVEQIEAEAIVHIYEIDQATGEYALIRSIGPKDSFQMQRPYPILIDPVELVSDLAE